MTPSSVLDPGTIQLWLTALYEAIKVPKGSEKQKTYGHCRDNGVAAVGKIIKTHSTIFDPRPALTLWIHLLPLRHDKDEGMVQNELLADIMMSQPDLILGANKVANLQKVLNIYGEIAGNKKLYNEQVSKKIRDHINQLKGDQFFNENLAVIMAGVSEKHKENIQNFMK